MDAFTDSLTYVVSLVTEYGKFSGKDSQWLEIYPSSFSVVTLFAVTGASTFDAVFRLCCDAMDEPVDVQMIFWFTAIDLATSASRRLGIITGEAALNV
jgi:hypothetical protein